MKCIAHVVNAGGGELADRYYHVSGPTERKCVEKVALFEGRLDSNWDYPAILSYEGDINTWFINFEWLRVKLIHPGVLKEL